MLRHTLWAAALTAMPLVAGAQPYETPTMGWSSWNTYGVNINENVIKTQAKAMKSKGLMGVGYKYINIDDGFFGGRDANGHLLIHPTRFPNGMKPVVDYIHSLGLKAGIYSDAGYNTCGSYHNGDKIGEGVGLYQHDQEDIDYYFKDLGFDFIKVDFCGGDPIHNKDGLSLPVRDRYTAIREAMDKVGRDGLRLNVCRWAFPGTWVHDIATSWRTTGDIGCWWTSVRDIIKENLYLSAYATQGHYNDMDMLEVGRGLSEEEDKTHFGMWCIMSSPLLIGCDMNSLKTTTLNLLKNTELIALNQDPLALQAYVAQYADGAYVLVKDIETRYGNVRAVAFYNPTDEAVTTKVDFATIDLGGEVLVRDLFAKKDVGTMTGSMTVDLPAHGTRIYRLQATERYERTKYEAETAWLGDYQEISWPQTGSYDEKAICSGGMKVGWLGGSSTNDLQWRNVYSHDGGEYTISIAYMCGEDRKLTINVNGTDVKTLTLNSGSFDKIKRLSGKIKLQQGENIIRLHNDNGWMPDIDYMALKPTIPADIDDVQEEEDENNGKVDVYTVGGQLLRHNVDAHRALAGQPSGTYIVGRRVVIKH